MNVLGSGGSKPSRPPKDKPARKKHPLTEEDARRLEKLKEAYVRYRSSGNPALNFTQLSKKMGRTAATASGYFNGYLPLNVEWMLVFARELGKAPQEIFTDDWPFPEMTTSPMLARMLENIRKLDAQQQALILKIIDGDYTGPRARK